jgi:hypothetical protein
MEMEIRLQITNITLKMIQQRMLTLMDKLTMLCLRAAYELFTKQRTKKTYKQGRKFYLLGATL